MVKALVIGNGGREHAIAWALLQSPQMKEVICVPGNGGTATLTGCRNLALSTTDAIGIARFCLVNNVAFVIVGPEQPLAAGITDQLKAEGIAVFGPTQAGAQIEASKAWAKALMTGAGVPTAVAESFTDADAAIAYVKTMGAPIVIKADGLAAGKGVTVAMTEAEAIAAITASFDGQFGAAGQTVLIEEYLTGQEASVLAVTDGQTIRPLLPAQDHKQVGEGDTGPNTGGMGAYAPTPVVPTSLHQRIQTEVLEPTLQALQAKGIDYRGILYAGLMITAAGDPKVIEFNCRFGDPETQAVLPLLDTPLDEIVMACLEQRLADFPEFEWKPGAAACVVLASGGYPGAYEKKYPITGLDEATETGAIVFHAGTRLRGNEVLTDGGRVLGVTALGETFDVAIANAYKAVDSIHFENAYCRRDIGFRVAGKA